MLYSLKDIAVRRGGRCILDIKKLEIAAGNVYSLVGPNGAGKSTLLNILGFLLKPDCGTMLCNDELVQNSAKNYHQLRQRIVLVEQYPILFTGPVWKNIDFALKIRKIPRQQRSTRIAEVLERVGMQTFANADAHKLSGGETKRIALARALAIEPEVLLCDEPTANVDSGITSYNVCYTKLLRADKILKMSTTTSTQSSGLLDILLPAFQKDTGIRVKVMAKGTGAAIRDGMDGNVDIIFVHAKEREEQFVANGYGVKRYPVMHNDFVIIGPGSDPANIKGMKDAAAAIHKIAASSSRFISRGDDSGTHTNVITSYSIHYTKLYGQSTVQISNV